MFWLITGLSIGLFTHTVFRALTLSLVCDEAGTFFEQVCRSYRGLLTYEYAIGNHHLLNSLLMKVLCDVFWPHPFVLRLPNVAGHAVYLLATGLIARRFFRDPVGQLVAFVLLNLNPYTVSFFGLARGYGLGQASVAVSLLGLFRYAEKRQTRFVYLAYGGAYVAVLSHFTLLNYFVAVVAAVNLIIVGDLLREHEAGAGRGWGGVFGDWLARNGPTWIVSVLLILSVSWPMWRVMNSPRRGEYDGGTTGFWRDTVYLLWLHGLYTVRYGVLTGLIVKGLVVLTGVSVFAVSGWMIVRIRSLKGAILSRPQVVLLVLLVVSSLSTVAQFHLLGIPLLSRRTALFFAVLYALHAAWILGDTMSVSRFRCAARSAGCLIVVCLSIHFVRASEVRVALEYRFDTMTATMMEDLETLAAQEHRDTVSLGIHPLFYRTVDFYRQHMGYDFVTSLRTSEYEKCEYLYLLEDLQGVVVNSEDVEVVKRYDVSKAVLARRTSLAGETP